MGSGPVKLVRNPEGTARNGDESACLKTIDRSARETAERLPRRTTAAASASCAAAERLFAERGFRNVSVRDIAAEADVTHPLIYYYWSSKDGLLAAVIERSQARMRAAAELDADAPRRVTAIVREYLAHSRPTC